MKVYSPQISDQNCHRLWLLKQQVKKPMTKLLNEILDKYFSRQLKEVTDMKITEVEVMVSKKVAANYNSCCVAYTARAALDESEDHLEALQSLKDELVSKVQEALKPNNGRQLHAVNE